MQRTILLAGVLAAFTLVAPQAGAQIQPQQPSAGGGAAKFCLKQKAGGALNCTYQTMAQCQQASNKGAAGDCVENPAATTGAGSGGLKDQKKN